MEKNQILQNEKKYCDFNNIRNLAIKHYKEFKEVMNDIEKVNVNTHK